MRAHCETTASVSPSRCIIVFISAAVLPRAPAQVIASAVEIESGEIAALPLLACAHSSRAKLLFALTSSVFMACALIVRWRLVGGTDALFGRTHRLLELLQLALGG